MSDLQNLSENELQAMIENAKRLLDAKQATKRKDTLQQIKELAASINVTVEIIDSDKRRMRAGAKVPFKYAHPEDPSKRWTGRGMAPRWMQEFQAQGRDKSEFAI